MSIIFGFIFLFIAILIFASIGSFISERSSVPNIAIESVMVVAAFTYAIIREKMGSNGYGTMVLGILAAIVVGVIFNMILSVATIVFKGDPILVGTGLNMLTVPLIMAMIHKYAKVPKGINVDIVDSMKIGNFQWIFVLFAILALMALGGVIWVMKKTKYGIILNASGENAQAMYNAGFKVNRIRFLSLTIASVFMAIAGAFAAHFNTTFYFKGTGVNGLGFIALGIVILSQWRSKWLGVFAIMFGIAFSFAYNFTLIRPDYSLAVQYVIRMSPYLMPIIILPFISKSHNLPKQLGVPFYEKESRT